jgi:pilus assembly protein CpaB
MNRQTRTLVVVGLAVFFASLASYGEYRAIQAMPPREVPVSTKFAVVARENLGVGTLLAAQHLQLVAWPESAPVQGGFSTVEAVVGRGLVAAVVANEPITESKVAPREAGAGLPPLIPPGMRALSVRVNEVIGVAGYTMASTRVDVLVTMRSGQESMTRVVVSNVQVLASGTKVDQERTQQGQAPPTTVVTLLVTPQDAERVALAQTEGQIMLALRNPLDVSPSETSGARMSALLASPGATQPTVRRSAPSPPRVVARPPPPTPPPGPYTIEAIRAGKRTQEVVK